MKCNSCGVELPDKARKLLPMITGYGIVDLGRDRECLKQGGLGVNSALQYFDGGDRFYQNTYRLMRVGQNYEAAAIGDRLHGEADKTTLTKEFVYTKAEGSGEYKKYPREFQSYEGYSNPEAVVF